MTAAAPQRAAAALPTVLDGQSVPPWGPWRAVPPRPNTAPAACPCCGAAGSAEIAYAAVEAGGRRFAAVRCTACALARCFRIDGGLWTQVAQAGGTAPAPAPAAVPVGYRPPRITAEWWKQCRHHGCTATDDIRPFACGPRCPLHTPSALAGRPEPDQLLAEHRAALAAARTPAPTTGVPA